MPSNNALIRTCLSVAVAQAISFSNVQAATITVNTTSDVSGPGPCTLREAIQAFETPGVGSSGCTYSGAFGVADTIEFDALLNGETISLTQGQLEIEKEITINGPLPDRLTIDAGLQTRVIEVYQTTANLHNLVITGGNGNENGGGVALRSSIVKISNCSITSNSASGIGGGIWVDFGQVNIHQSTISDNSASDGGGAFFYAATSSMENSVISNNSASSDGGGIFASLASHVTISDSTISENSASETGGGIIGSLARMSIVASTISENRAGEVGGGINLELNSQLENLENSTLSGNRAIDEGGGLFIKSGASTIINHSTITDNYAQYSGGGVHALTGSTLTLSNSLVSGNSVELFFGGVREVEAESGTTISGIGNVFGQIQYSTAESISGWSGFLLGFSVVASSDGNRPTALSKIIAPLDENGGFTQTHALISNSPAINAASTDNCPSVDQRGESRASGACDSGAFEYIDDENCYVIKTVNGNTAIFCF